MKVIDIQGVVVSGCGKFRDEILLPNNLLSGYKDWMHAFAQGTLNVRFSISGLPQPLQTNGLKDLDLNDSFPPAIYQSGTVIPSNTIQPNAQNPRRGDLQLWRAILNNCQTRTEHKCYLIRRVGSGYSDVAEILGQQNFHDDCSFADGHQVSIQMFYGTLET
jgi:hypothetical protein